jgi:hypothetical protein
MAKSIAFLLLKTSLLVVAPFGSGIEPGTFGLGAQAALHAISHVRVIFWSET